MKFISIRNASTHNLKNLDVDIPKNKLVVVTGVSGSGKSSLAFDTLYAEGQRRYVESLSTYARQFLSVMDKPEVDSITGLSPAIAIDQKTASHNPRSTVGTVTEIYDYLRLLFAKIGQAYCPEHGVELKAENTEQITQHILRLENEKKYMLLSPLLVNRKGAHHELFKGLIAKGFVRVKINKTLQRIEDAMDLDPHKKHTIDLVVDRFSIQDENKQKIRESLETAQQFSSLIKVESMENNKETHVFSTKHNCPICSYSLPELEPRLFSFNSPVGYCQECEGLGYMESITPNKLLKSKAMSLEEGAISGWGNRSERRFVLLKKLAEEQGFSTKIPFEKLDDSVKKLIFYGDKNSFPGIINWMNDHYKSNSLSKEILKDLQEITTCLSCKGTRLNPMANHVFIQTSSLPKVTQLSLNDCCDFFNHLKLKGSQKTISQKIILEIKNRINFLIEVGLGYLTLSRASNTLSGGESQRIRLASQIGSGLNNVLYVLDEPSIGLHQRDNERLLNSLEKLKQLDNTIVVIEHDEDTMKRADHIIDIGPGAGIHGGEIIAQGDWKEIVANKNSLTGRYLSGEKQVVETQHQTKKNKLFISLKGAQGNNLKQVDCKIPLGCLTVVSGVSGSGKSTLINSTLYPAAYNVINRTNSKTTQSFDSLEIHESIKRLININQSPIGRTPRSNPATYTGLFNEIRQLFSQLKESRSRGYSIGRFSFNVKGGRCEACSGDGLKKIEMLFMPDVYVKCDICNGKRYNPETLEIQYKNQNIYEVLEMTIQASCKFFENVPNIKRKLDCLIEVGLGYLKIGQQATTLSGGEAQRIKLAKELARRDTGNTLYILDEPTTGLHFEDMRRLLNILFALRNNGNTIVVIEHNIDVIRAADWSIDLGPEGGDNGGKVIFCDWFDAFKKCQTSHTQRFL